MEIHTVNAFSAHPSRTHSALTQGPRFGRWLAITLVGLGMAVSTSMAQARTAPESFADLAEKLLPSVVNISTTQVVEGQPGIEVPTVPPGSPFEDFFKEFFEKNQPRRQQRRATSLGSGFIIDTKGYVVTNNHVIQDADEITVVLHDDTRLEAKVIGRDPKTDIAILKVEPEGPLTAVGFGDSDEMRIGDWLVAIGNPFGFGGTVTTGIISARGRDINAGPYDDFLQTDAPINRGNSGGPMFNLDGEVIGIATAIFSPSGGSVGIGFAIPSNSAEPVIRQLLEHGEVRRGWLGVRIQTVTEEIAETLGLKEPIGALVASVIPDGPAEKAGIKPGDVIIEFDGTLVEQMRKLPRIVADTEVGNAVPVKVWRDNGEVDVKVTIAVLEEGEEEVAEETSEGESPGGKTTIEDLGLTVASIDARLREQYELDNETKGVVVTEVDPAGPSAAKGIREGDVIVEVSQNEVNTPAELAERIKEAREAGRRLVLLLIEGEGGLRFVTVRIDEE
jgi:serine protease Do